LENLEKISLTDGPSPATLPVDDKKSVTSSVGKSTKYLNDSNTWCHYYDINNNSMADYRAIVNFKQQKKASFEAKSGLRKKSLAFLYEVINTLILQLKPKRL
jgi:hypothetical protein